MNINEQQLEELCMGWIQETGWRFANGSDISAVVLKQVACIAQTITKTKDRIGA